VAGPGDDVFALGVTAYRLVTGMYPPSPVPQRDEAGHWRMMPLYLPPPHELNRRVEPLLSALILRMLSLTREERGGAGELAKALEAAAGGAEPEVEAPAGVPVRERPRARGLSWRSERVLAGVGVCLALGLGLAVHVHWQGAASRERLAVGPGRTGEGPVGLGSSMSEAPVAPVKEPSEQEAIGQEPLPEPHPRRQIRPDARGQCPGHKQVAINGGCWVVYPVTDAEECEQNGYVLIKGQCYAPALETRRRKPPPTSAPPQ
jgi:serine/threonine-protein kinase